MFDHRYYLELLAHSDDKMYTHFCLIAVYKFSVEDMTTTTPLLNCLLDNIIDVTYCFCLMSSQTWSLPMPSWLVPVSDS